MARFSEEAVIIAARVISTLLALFLTVYYAPALVRNDLMPLRGVQVLVWVAAVVGAIASFGAFS